MPKPLVSIYLPISRADHAWGLYVTGVGYAQVGKGQKYPAVTHPTGYLFDWERGRRLDHFALVSITAGSGIFESASQPEVAVAPGNVMMLFPGEWH